MSAEKNNDRPDPQTAPVAPNQSRENLVRLYVVEASTLFSSTHLAFRFERSSNYHEENEGLINRQINLELYASYAYTAMAHHFDRWDVALKGKEEKNKPFAFQPIFVLTFQDIINSSKKWLKKKMNMRTNSWSTRINAEAPSYCWISRFVGGHFCSRLRLKRKI